MGITVGSAITINAGVIAGFCGGTIVNALGIGGAEKIVKPLGFPRRVVHLFGEAAAGHLMLMLTGNSCFGAAMRVGVIGSTITWGVVIGREPANGKSPLQIFLGQSAALLAGFGTAALCLTAGSPLTGLYLSAAVTEEVAHFILH